LVEGRVAAKCQGLRRRTHGAGHEARACRRREFIRGLAGEPRGRDIQIVCVRLETEFGQNNRRALKGVRLDDVGAGGEIRTMDAQHPLGTRPTQLFDASLEARSAVVRRRRTPGLQESPHRAVEDQDARREGVGELGVAKGLIDGHTDILGGGGTYSV
jgi:hypothetical protein